MHERSSLVVAIDGPSGSGKSSVARHVASRLGLRYLDTGAMYRAITWSMLDRGIDLDNAQRVAATVPFIKLTMGDDPAAPTVHADGQDVTAAIRETRISESVSKVATNLKARTQLVAMQQAVAREGGVVIEGRDITTVVAPDADVRILLTASERVRLARRARELHGADHSEAVAATHDQVVRRDADDATVATFHEAADGVTVVDSSDLDLDATVQAVLDVVRSATGVDA